MIDKNDFEFGEESVREYLNSLQYSGKKAEKVSSNILRNHQEVERMQL